MWYQRKPLLGAAEMALWLRILAALEEDSGLVLSTHIIPRDLRLSSGICGHQHGHGANTYMQAEYTHACARTRTHAHTHTHTHTLLARLVVQTYHLNYLEAEEGELEVRGMPKLQTGFKASLGNLV